MSKMQILHGAIHEFPLGSSPTDVLLKCRQIDVKVENDNLVDNKLYGQLPHTVILPFYAATPTATLTFFFDDTPALQGFDVTKGAVTP
jgi:hypothetical protein